MPRGVEACDSLITGLRCKQTTLLVLLLSTICLLYLPSGWDQGFIGRAESEQIAGEVIVGAKNTLTEEFERLVEENGGEILDKNLAINALLVRLPESMSETFMEEMQKIFLEEC